MKRYLDSLFPSTAAAQEPAAASPTADGGTVPATVGRACPECGEGAAPEQDWCLECGSRIEQGSPRWHQPVAVMASVALIFVAGLALALSEVAKDADIAGAKTVRKTVAAAPPPTPASPTPDTPTVPKPSKGSDVPSTSKNNTDDNGPSIPSGGDTGSSTPDTGSSAGSFDTGSSGATGSSGSTGSTTPTPAPVDEWPSDKKGYTVVLLSTTTKSEAEALARKATAKGFDAGILSTDDFNLRPDADAAAADAQSDYSEGLWLVWAGRYKSSNAANQGVDELSAKGLEGDSVEYVTLKKSASTSSNDGSGSTP